MNISTLFSFLTSQSPSPFQDFNAISRGADLLILTFMI